VAQGWGGEGFDVVGRLVLEAELDVWGLLGDDLEPGAGEEEPAIAGSAGRLGTRYLGGFVSGP
jgi:hypothetical protein